MAAYKLNQVEFSNKYTKFKIYAGTGQPDMCKISV
jgi:hypothetical protein